MNKRPLGNNALNVSALGLGCWSFAGAYGPTDEEESHRTLAKALDLGIDFLDTANVYGGGLSEQVIGSFLKANGNSFKIATKGGIKRAPGSTERVFDNKPDYLAEALDLSLERLGVEYVDLYYIHRRDPEIEIEDLMETLVGFKQAGKIGGIGFSEISPSSLRRAHAVHPVTAVQSEYSLWSRMPDLGMVQACKDLGVTFVPFSPLGRGIFGKITPDPATFGKLDFRKNNPRFLEPDFSRNVEIVERYKIYAADKGHSPAALAIAWCLHQGEHLIPIPGTRSSEHLEELAAGTEITLSTADLAEIEGILPVGFAHGDRYSAAQQVGAERYC